VGDTFADRSGRRRRPHRPISGGVAAPAPTPTYQDQHRGRSLVFHRDESPRRPAAGDDLEGPLPTKASISEPSPASPWPSTPLNQLTHRPRTHPALPCPVPADCRPTRPVRSCRRM